MTDNLRHIDQPDIPAALVAWALDWSAAEGDGAMTLTQLAREAGLSRRSLTYWQQGGARPYDASLGLLWAAMSSLCGLGAILPRSYDDRYGSPVHPARAAHLSVFPGCYLIVWLDDAGVPRRVARGSWPDMMSLDELTAQLRAELAPRPARRRARHARATCARPLMSRCGEGAW